DPSGKVRVPDVTGLTLAEAREAVEDAGLDPQPEGDLDKGRVESQEPAAGTSAAKGAAVKLVFSLQADARVNVPDVTKQSFAEAKKALEAAGLQAEADGDADKGVVQSQGPAGDTPVRKGTKVVLTLRPALERVAVPDLKGQTLAAAQKALDDLGLVAQPEGDPDKGKVASQNPAAGIEVPKGSAVV